SDIVRHRDEDESLRRLSLCFMEDALADISSSEADKLQGQYRDFYAWMKDKLQSSTLDAVRPDRALLIQSVAELGPRGALLCRVGPCLASILRNQQKLPLDRNNEGGLVEKVPSNHDDGVPQGAALLRQIVHKQPRARVLEIGARVDGVTRAMLEALGPLGS